MKYVYAVVVAIVLTVLMFVFMDVTSRQTEVWDNQGIELPVYRRLQVSASMMIANYWIYFAPMILIGCFTVAAMVPSKSLRR